jgi:hypothetical protein
LVKNNKYLGVPHPPFTNGMGPGVSLQVLPRIAALSGCGLYAAPPHANHWHDCHPLLRVSLAYECCVTFTPKHNFRILLISKGVEIFYRQELWPKP